MGTQKNNFINVPVIILSAVVISVFSVSFIRENYQKLFPAGNFEPSDKDVFRWIQAVEEDNQTKAVLYATRICGGCEMKELPDSDYLQVVSDLKISTLILNAPFSRYDFLRWKDAFRIKRFIGEITDGKSAGIEGIFSRLLDKIEYRKTPEGASQALTLTQIIDRGYGNTHEMARLLCECAYQAGYEVQTVSLFDDSRNLVHVVCEIRGNDESIVADARFKKLWGNMTFAKIAENPSALSGIWPDNIVKSMKNHIYGVPSEFQDYKACNQAFAENIKRRGINDVPVFGADPRKRIQAYLKYFAPGNHVRITYWRYPFFVLMSQPDFPKDWKLDYEKMLDK
jgi:hypothetical protein